MSQQEKKVYGYAFSEGGISFYVFPRFWITEDRARGVVEAVPLSLNDYCASQPFEGGRKVSISKDEHDGRGKILNREGGGKFFKC
ncbi:MAG: hypothetical protein AABX65_01775 [Nanoarchaeota archaeon]